jgi:integrase
LLDVIEKRGERQADVCLTIIRSLTNWYEAREDDYVSPVARRMRRDTAPSRERILDDGEVRAVWNAAEGTYGNLVKFALLTGQRRQKLSELRWDDLVVTPAGTEWRIRSEKREKGTGEALVLPQLALDVIAAQPRLVSNPHVFAGRGAAAFNSFSDGKAALDAKAGIAPWVLHDLRRTARSLLSRAGVRPDIAEKVIGHAVGGVQAIYDRHHFTSEKGDALQALATLIERILNPPAADNVIPLVREATS